MGISAAQRFLVVAHDRGGAEVIADFLPSLGGEVRLLIDGPARDVLPPELVGAGAESLSAGIAWADTIILSTGWQTDWELAALRAALDSGRRTVTVLDNWVNFAGRFAHHGLHVEPGELWVVDSLAARIAAEEFPEAVVRVLPWNHYSAVVADMVAARAGRPEPSGGPTRILFIGENVGEFAQTLAGEADFGFSQFDALAHLGEVLHRRLGAEVTLRVRPHPSEDPQRYRDVIDVLPVPTELSHGSLLDDVAWCDWAVGLSSIALYYASQSGVPTYTCFPTAGSEYHRSPWGFPTVEDGVSALS
jgi:hypothetical protein